MRLLPPGLGPLHIHAELAQGHARKSVIGLMRIAVEHNLVHAFAELAISNRLQDIGVLGIAIVTTKGSKSFAGDDFFAIDMPGSCCLLGVVMPAPKPLRKFYWNFVVIRTAPG